MKSQIFRRPAFTLMLALFVVASLPAFAQMGVEPSTGEDVAIAFFKTAGTNPDFDKWAREGKAFKTVAPAKANDFLFDEKQRLMKLWRKYDNDDPIIDISANVYIDLKSTLNEDGEQLYWMYITFGNDSAIYFPFEYLEYKIAVIPQMIETLTIQQIQKEQFSLMYEEFKGKLSGEGNLSLQLKPIKAYIHQPYKIDGMDQWALLTDVATMSIKSHHTSAPFWTYSAQWYTSPVTEQLNDLYKLPSAQGNTSAP